MTSTNERMEGVCGMSEWKPIETAPKDGVAVLAFCPSDSPQVVALRHMSGCDDGGWSMWAYVDEVLNDVCPDGATPTHWQPLPETPQ
jgi:hypothetical protein